MSASSDTLISTPEQEIGTSSHFPQHPSIAQLVTRDTGPRWYPLMEEWHVSESVPAAGSRTSKEVRAWSEDPLTARARSVWTSGDFLPIARSFAPGAEEFITRLGLRPGEVVLDVACGTGNLAIPAALAGARVSGIDIAPNLIAEAQLEARAAGVAIAFEVGDAESLPYLQGQFDTTVTMFGAMFAYRPERAAAELLRVTRPNGRVAMANWTV